jgi:hypothetical protein
MEMHLRTLWTRLSFLLSSLLNQTLDIRLGGISGHAGAFGTAGDVALLAAAFLFPDDMEKPLIRNSTAQLFMTEFNHSQSSRALGWNTNDPAVFGTFPI